MNLNLNLRILALSLLTVLVHAGPEKTEKYGYPYKMATYACQEAVGALHFGANMSTYTSMCAYPPASGSVLQCNANKLGAYSSQFNKSIAMISNYCGLYYKYNSTKEELYSVYTNVSKYLIEYDPATNYTEIVLYQPVNIPSSLIDGYYYYYKHLYFNFDRTSFLAGLMYLYFVLVFVIHAASNLVKKTGIHTKFDNKVIRWYRANIGIPALFNGKHTNAPRYYKVFSTLVPTRVESVVVFFFVALNFLLACFHYDLESPEESRKLVLAVFVADRTGLLSFGLIPLLILLAGRNNVITAITGIPYTSLIFYHKWVARLMWIHAMIHSACWTAYAVYMGYLSYYYTETYWIWGVVATIIGSFVLIQAFHQFRTMSYEVFLVLHIILVILFIVGCYWHCYSLGWLEWVYVSWAVWGFDRIVRWVRMGLFGTKEAEVKYLGDDTFRVKVPYNKAVFNAFPGAYAYLYFLTPWHFWQSHPFTVVKSHTEDNTLLFFIKTKTGITKRIRKRLDALPDGVTTLKVCVEGAYGHRAPVAKYDKVLLMAGGNGIPGLYSHAMDLATRGGKQEVKLQWIVRNFESLNWFKEELETLHNTNVQVDIFITRGTKLETNESSSKEEKTSSADDVSSIEDLTKTFNKFNLHYQRPDVDSYIQQEFSTGGSVAVMSCGPPRMVDDIRAAVARRLQKAEGRVDLFEELQVW